MASSIRNALVSVDYEVFGRVQGVFFRKHTQKAAQGYGLVGWVMNTRNGTVKGQVQGQAEKVATMKHWLRFEGSPYSQIERCKFTNEIYIDHLDYESFSVKGGWKTWLKTKGSPKSRIDKCVFTNARDLTSLEFSSFDIRKK